MAGFPRPCHRRATAPNPALARSRKKGRLPRCQIAHEPSLAPQLVARMLVLVLVLVLALLLVLVLALVPGLGLGVRVSTLAVVLGLEVPVSALPPGYEENAHG